MLETGIAIMLGVFAGLGAWEMGGRWEEARLRRKAREAAGRATPSSPGRTSVFFGKFAGRFFLNLDGVAARMNAWLPEKWRKRLEKQLGQSSFWRGHSAAEWWGVKEAAALAAFFSALVLGAGFFPSVLFAGGAFFLPDLWLLEQIGRRRQRLLRELPDNLDLLAACLEAGLGLEAAIGVWLERGHRSPLYEEYQEMMRTLSIGLSRREALQALAGRVAAPEVTAFAVAVIQAEQLGVSIAETLKQQSEQLRIKRSQRVEKLAMEAPVKLLIPLVIFIFPVVFLILFGPVFIRLLSVF